MNADLAVPDDGPPHLRRAHPGRDRGAARRSTRPPGCATSSRWAATRPADGSRRRAATSRTRSSWSRSSASTRPGFCVGRRRAPRDPPALARPRQRPAPPGGQARRWPTSPSPSSSSAPRPTGGWSRSSRALGCDRPVRGGRDAVRQRPRPAADGGDERHRDPAATWPRRLERVADDPAAVAELGVEVATGLSRELVEAGAPGHPPLHAQPLRVGAPHLGQPPGSRTGILARMPGPDAMSTPEGDAARRGRAPGSAGAAPAPARCSSAAASRSS